MNLDAWVPDPDVRICHRRECGCGAGELWRAAGLVRLCDCRLLGRLIQLRVPGVRASFTFRAMFAEHPFRLLEEGEVYSLSGVCGRIWSRRDFATLESPADFLEWSAPGTVRVLFASWAEPASHGSALVSEVRVDTVDRRARLLLRALEPFIGAFQGLVGTEGLNAAVARARESARVPQA